MTTIQIHQRRTGQIWRAGGMIWIISVTFFFALLDLYFAKLQITQTVSIGVAILIISGTLLVWSIKTLQQAKKLPIEKSKKDLQTGGSMRKWFLIVLIIEIIALNIASVALLKTNHFEYIVPIDILIVSLHFIPLGRIFSMPIYYLLGSIVSVIVILVLLLVSPSSHWGHLISIAAIPSLLFILLNWLVVIFILHDSRKYLRK